MICTLRHCAGYQFKEDEKVGACGTYGEKRNTCRVLMRKHGRMRLRHRHRHRKENNNKTDFKEMELEDMGRIYKIYVAQEKRKSRFLVNTVTYFRVLLNSAN